MALWTVKAFYDPEAQVWVALESDLPGLLAEGETLEVLAAKLDYLVPWLVELNGEAIPPESREGAHEFRLIAHHEMQRKAAA